MGEPRFGNEALYAFLDVKGINEGGKRKVVNALIRLQIADFVCLLKANV